MYICVCRHLCQAPPAQGRGQPFPSAMGKAKGGAGAKRARDSDKAQVPRARNLPLANDKPSTLLEKAAAEELRGQSNIS